MTTIEALRMALVLILLIIAILSVIRLWLLQ